MYLWLNNVRPKVKELFDIKLNYILFYKYTWLVYLFVSVCPINAKLAELIGPKFVEPHKTPGKVFDDQNFKN